MDASILSWEARLNLETAQITWIELERFFAKGQVIEVSSVLDLVAVAAAFVKDDTALCKQWLDNGEARRLPDEVAKQWAADDSHLWAVVVAPWVLAQNRV